MDHSCIGAPLEVKFADGGAPGTFEGMASVFGVIDSHGDLIEPGAFAKGLSRTKGEGRALPPMYKNHGLASGRDPIGVWDEMEEDGAGLRVKGRLIGLDTESGKWTYAQLREGALKGLSIGYRVPPHGSKLGNGQPGQPRRYLKEIVLGEVSLVDAPSNALARVHSMKHADEVAREIKTIREFEQFLRDEGGFSRKAAAAIAAGGWKAMPNPRDEDGVSEIIRDALARLASSIR